MPLPPYGARLIDGRANSVEDAIRRGQRQVEQVRIKMGLQMDDRTFQAALLETQVLSFLEESSLRRLAEVIGDAYEGPHQVEL